MLNGRFNHIIDINLPYEREKVENNYIIDEFVPYWINNYSMVLDRKRN